MSVLTYQKLEEAYILIYENASELLEESKILLDHQKYARAYALSQIAYEEMAKLPIIFQEATKSIYKETHDWKKFYKRLRSHESKNKLNYVMEDVLSINGLRISSEKIYDNLKFVNHVKNISLYSDIKNNRFTKPSNEISRNLAVKKYEVVSSVLSIYKMADYHSKGNIRKSISTEEAKKRRESFKEMGLL